MTLHTMPEAMMQEALAEMITAADWCTSTSKPGSVEGAVFGYPAAVLLCAAISGLGSWATPERSSKGQFRAVLLDRRFFDLGIDRNTAELLYERVRNFATHNSIIGQATTIDVGTVDYAAIVRSGDHLTIRLIPLLEQTRHAVELLASDPSRFISAGAQAKRSFDLRAAGLAEVAPGQASTSTAAASGMVLAAITPSTGIWGPPDEHTEANPEFR